MSTTERDARRWDTLTRLAQDTSASESERAQARARLEELRLRHGGRPEARTAPSSGSPPGPDWWKDFHVKVQEAAKRRQQDDRKREKLDRETAVRMQRALVEVVQGWQSSAILTELHRLDRRWRTEEIVYFKRTVERMTGSSRSSDR